MAVALVFMGTATAAAANVLVVRSVGPSAKAYPAGRSLADNARITLQPGDTLVLLDARGTRTVRGPGTFMPGGASKAAPSAALASLTGDRPQRRARIGAVRTGLGVRMPNVWHVDVAKSGPLCVADPANLMLWRADPSRPESLVIERGTASRQLQWPAGQATLAWPRDLPVVAGAEYRLRSPQAATPTVVTTRLLPSKPIGLEASAAALVANGCQAQLDYLIDAAALPAQG